MPETEQLPRKEPKSLIGQHAMGFLGVNLRQERMSLADQDVAKSINADLHTQPGSMLLRLGSRALNRTALTDTAIRRLARVNGVRYQVAGTSVYRDFQRILNGTLSGNRLTTLLPYRPLNDLLTWMFIADDATMQKDDGTTVRKWGIAAPTVAPVCAKTVGGSLGGAYSAKYTYARVTADGKVAHESNPSPVSNSITLSSNKQRLTIGNLTASSDGQVTHYRIYRTVAGGTSWLFDQMVPTGTTDVISTTADGLLGEAVDDDNDVPPNASFQMQYQEHTFLCRDAENPSYLWYSKRYRPESVPLTQFLDIGTTGDPLQCGVSMAGMLGVFSLLTKYRIVGNATSGFVPQEAISSRGTPCPMAAIPTEFGAVFVARDGVFSTNFVSPDTPFAEDILPLFFNETVNDMNPINWAAATTLTAETSKNRLYLAYPSGTNIQPDTVAVYSSDTKKWYFYQYPQKVGALLFEEDLDQLTAGEHDGFVYALENGTTDAGTTITMTAETRDFYGQYPLARKLFLYYKVDADCGTATPTVELYVDGVLVRSTTISGSRTKLLLRVPEGTMGYQWRVRVSYAGAVRVRVYGVEAMWIPMELA